MAGQNDMLDTMERLSNLSGNKKTQAAATRVIVDDNSRENFDFGLDRVTRVEAIKDDAIKSIFTEGLKYFGQKAQQP